jgi:SET domain-containing protein
LQEDLSGNGTKIIEYTGDIISSDEADEIGCPKGRGPFPYYVFFTRLKTECIYGNTGGDAKIINHSCNPNSEGVQYDDKIFIVALRSIPKGEELTYDYHLIVDGKIDKKSD